jgi:HEAT repeat protein
MNNDEKIAWLDSVDEEVESCHAILLKLITLAKDKSPYIRSKVARLLVDYVCEEAMNALLLLLDDKNYMVRTESADSLSYFPYHNVLTVLKRVAENDKHYLVRGYAISSIALISKHLDIISEELKLFFETRSRSENRIFCKLNCYFGLYVLGEIKYLDSIIAVLKSKNYLNRCAAMNVLTEILDDNNSSILIDTVQRLLPNEKSNAVKDMMDNFLKENINEK